MDRNSITKTSKIYGLIILGSTLAAIGIDLFLIPNKIAPGGVSGIATVLFYLSNGYLPVGMTMIAFDIPLFILGYKFIGRQFVIRTMFSSIGLAVLIDVLKPYTDAFLENYIISTDGLSNDLLLYSIFGGLLVGLGLGIVFKSGATTGGTDLAARLVHHIFPQFSIGSILLVIDGCVIVFAAIAFKSILIALYAIVTIVVTSKIIDAILEGVNFAKCVYIISDKPDEISKIILSDLDRGVTSLKGIGKYTGADKEVLMCILHRNQLPALKTLVKNVDERAFVILSDVREVFGEGFSQY